MKSRLSTRTAMMGPSKVSIAPQRGRATGCKPFWVGSPENHPGAAPGTGAISDVEGRGPQYGQPVLGMIQQHRYQKEWKAHLRQCDQAP